MRKRFFSAAVKDKLAVPTEQAIHRDGERLAILLLGIVVLAGLIWWARVWAWPLRFVHAQSVQPTYIIAFIPWQWKGSQQDFEQAAQSQFELFMRESDIDQFADVRVVLVHENFTELGLEEESALVFGAIELFGAQQAPADRYIALTDGDIVELGLHDVAGYSTFDGISATAEAEWVVVSSHELGHTYGLCDEYLYSEWERQNLFLGGCPNPFPANCQKQQFCEGTPAANGNDSIMGSDDGVPGYSYNQTCYDHLQAVFTQLFGATPLPPDPMPTPEPAVQSLAYIFGGEGLWRWDGQLGFQALELSTVQQPDISPDGQQVVFASARGRRLELYIRRMNEKAEHLEGQPGRSFAPRWHPDGNRIVFASDAAGSSQLYMLTVGGGSAQPLAGLPAPANWPSVRRDGGQLAFAAAPAGDWDIFVVDLDALGQPVIASLRAVINRPGADISPDWSCDGQQLAFASQQAGGLDIYLVRLADGGLQAVAVGPQPEWAPRWLATDQLVYQAVQDGRITLWGADIRSKRVFPLSGTQGMVSWPGPAVWPCTYP
jgi:Tol biopolymer transport system component